MTLFRTIISGVTIDRAGNLYGTAYTGGAHNSGSAFKLVRAGSRLMVRCRLAP
jgi:uncharacterized repeat protein (TIGR03803 family)